MKKIVILGPESTGKSTLCEQLAACYNTQWVPEYARTYLQKNGTQYKYEDLFEIAKGQVENEEIIVKSQESIVNSQESLVNSQESIVNGQKSIVNSSHTNLNPQPVTPNPQPATTNLIFIDTDLYTIKIWSEIAFNKCDNRILTQIAFRKYDVYLLCNTDLPWAEDSMREYPDLKSRQKIYHHYRDALINQKIPWIDIKGNYGERLASAIAFVDKVLF